MTGTDGGNDDNLFKTNHSAHLMPSLPRTKNLLLRFPQETVAFLPVSPALSTMPDFSNLCDAQTNGLLVRDADS